MKHQEKTKEEMAQSLRRLLAADIEFEKLSKEDLTRLFNILTGSSFLFWLKISRKSLKENVLEKHPLLKKADTLTTVLLSFLKRS